VALEKPYSIGFFASQLSLAGEVGQIREQSHWKIEIILDDLFPASREKTFAAESKRLRSSGLPVVAIAEKLGFSKSSVWRMLKTPDE
jgi:hypothetical protein